MRQAAVGFQCPSCVNEGARSTRSGRTAYGGRRSENPALTSQILIGLNALVWLLILVTGGASSPLVDRLSLLPEGGLFRFPDGTVQTVDGVANGAVWQLVTSMFTHVHLWHIGFNMLALWFLGPPIEAAIGRLRFVALYLFSGLVGSAFVYWLTPIHTSTAGASGAIFGLMGALLVMARKIRADLSQLMIWIGINFVITFVGSAYISWQGHLGGFLGGALIAAILVYSPRAQRPLWQTVGLGVLGVLIVVSLVARTLVLS
jgi:membrane associated rhomboid family serine protease